MESVTLLFHKGEMLCTQEASCIQMRLKSVGVVGYFTKCSCWKCKLYQITEFNHGQYIAGQQKNLKKITFLSYTKKSHTT